MEKIFASTSNDVEQREIEHAKIARRLAAECVVLLENDGVLPLQKPQKVALFGTGARNTIKGGTGSGDVNTRSVVSIEQGFENAGVSVSSKAWLDRQDAAAKAAKDKYLADVNEEAAQKKVAPFTIMFDRPFEAPAACPITPEDLKTADTDTAIYVLSRNSGEGADRYAKKGDYLPFDEEIEQVRLLTAHFSNVILLLNVGGVMELKELRQISGLNAIVLMTQLGNIGGDAICDVLLGKVTPSGKTVDTWACDYMDYPSSEKFSHNESVHDEMYEDGIYVGYRYFDSFEVKPEYCFGYGLSYTEFTITTEAVRVASGKVEADVNIKNAGTSYAGKEVVQLYVSFATDGLDKPYQELVAYQKTKELAPGESQKLTVSFPVSALASYDEETAAWKADAGEYVLRIGNSSRNTKVAAVLELEKDVNVYSCKNLFDLDVELAEILPYTDSMRQRIRKEIPQDAVRVKIDITEFAPEVVKYQGKRQEYTTSQTGKLTLDDVKAGKCTVEELVAQLTVEEMAQMCVGTLRADDSSVVGNASHMVPGAAGDTSSVIRESRKVRNMILADGPAGLRLQPHFKTDKAGKMIPGGDIIGDAYTPFPEDLDENNVIDYYQYCTAIPIGWALAQSWNTELVAQAGDMVGSEMEQFGVDLWLAPAMNIHRNPLCGRNFEYYSEDPLIAGKTAAAMTNGVQKHKGKGTTIKHFAVNNQEDNRYFVNAHVSERALREIYLKGFEIAVRESQPLSIMTSYNLLNGTHTANHHDLLQAMARDEWGFEGTIMTDWFTSQDMPEITGKYGHKYPISSSVGCIYAGNDIQMPGCQKNVDDIVEAVKSGKEMDGYTITLADLQYCTANIIRVVAKMS
jgi:beta-glucosidase